MSTLLERLHDLNHHIAFFILKHCFAIPKLTYILRTSCCFNFEPELNIMDNLIKSTMEQIINSHLVEQKWTISSLPVRFGGLGVRKITDVALPAFLSSVNSVTELVNMMLPQISDESVIANYSEALMKWSSIHDNRIPEIRIHQKEWDLIAVDRIVKSLTLSSDEEKARYNASIVKESNAWLTVLPSRHIGTLLDNNTFRISVALRLGCELCIPHLCKCGSQVNSNGIHGLSCRKSAGRIPCHSEVNNILHRALQTANIPSKLEPPIFRDDGRKRADGVTLIQWSRGQMLVWDATIRDTLAPSYIHSSSIRAGNVARRAVTDKCLKYKKVMENNYFFLPFACETLGPWCTEARNFINQLGKMIYACTGEPRSTLYLTQRISIAIQRTNAARVMGTFDSSAKLEEIFYILSNDMTL